MGAAFCAVALLLAALYPGAGAVWRTVAGTGKSGFGGTTFRSLVHDFAVETRLNSPWGLALDAAFDKLYVSDSVNGVVRSVDLQTGLMEVIAGSDVGGYSGDGGPAVEAQLQTPTGLALDEPGRVLYISDSRSHTVRAVLLDPGRVYQAEVNVSLPAKDGGLATAKVYGPFVMDTCPDTTSPSNPYHVTPLFLGSKFCEGSTGRGFVAFTDLIVEHLEFQVLATSGPGTYELRFRYADRYDRVHAAGDRRLRVTVNGVTVAASLLFRPTGNVQAGLRNKFEWVACSAQLDLLPPARNIVRLELAGYGGPRVDQLYVVPPRPMIWTVAGTGSAGPADCRHGCMANYPEVRDPLDSPLHTPTGLAFDDVDKILYIADSDNGRVLRLDTSAGSISTLAGGAIRGSTRDGETGGALAGKLFRPLALALDSARRWLYVSDAGDHKVRRMDLSQASAVRPIFTVAGFGRQQAPFPYQLRAPHGLAIDEASGRLYVADFENGRVRGFDIENGTCPIDLVSRLRCGHEGMGASECVSLGCCWDPTCLDGFNPDGRGPAADPLDVLTKVDQRVSDPPIAFIRRGSGFCCYPNLRELETLDTIDTPVGLAWDARDGGSMFVSSMRSHKVVRLVASESQCAADATRC